MLFSSLLKARNRSEILRGVHVAKTHPTSAGAPEELLVLGQWPSAGVVGGGRGEGKDPSAGCSQRTGCRMGSGGTRRTMSRQAAPAVMPARCQGAERLAPELSYVRAGESSTTLPAYPGYQKLAPVCVVKESCH